MDNILICWNSWMFYMLLIDVRKLPEYDLGKIETCTSFEGLCVKICTVLTYSAFVGII